MVLAHLSVQSSPYSLKTVVISGKQNLRSLRGTGDPSQEIDRDLRTEEEITRYRVEGGKGILGQETAQRL